MNTVSEQVKELRRFSDEYARNHVTLFNYRVKESIDGD